MEKPRLQGESLQVDPLKCDGLILLLAHQNSCSASAQEKCTDVGLI